MNPSLQIPLNLNFLQPTYLPDLVRIGNRFDGGYIIPKSIIPKIECLLSFGIFNDWSFEAGIKNLNADICIHAYDHSISKSYFLKRIFLETIKSIVLKSNFKKLHESFLTYLSYKSFFSGKNTHFQERIHNRIEHPSDADIDRIFERLTSNNIFLKMDIVGAEYRVIDDIMLRSDKILGFVIEFHDTEPYRANFVSSIKSLQKEFTIVHLHANNFGGLAADGLPEVIEITFIKNFLISSHHKVNSLPIQNLDAPNNPSKPDYSLLFSS